MQEGPVACHAQTAGWPLLVKAAKEVGYDRGIIIRRRTTSMSTLTSRTVNHGIKMLAIGQII